MSNCKHCGGPIGTRNPTGDCDHLYWPDNLSEAAKKANGIVDPQVVADLSVVQRGDEYYVVLEPVGPSPIGRREDGPYSTEDEARQVYDKLMGIAFDGGASKIPATDDGNTIQ